MAMPKEERPIRAFIPSYQVIKRPGLSAVVGARGEMQVILATSGIGKVAAAITTAELIRTYAPDCIINIGVSGGIHESTQQGDIVIADRICYHDVSCGSDIPWGQVQGFPLYYPTSEELRSMMNSSKEQYLTGLVVCGDRFLTDPKEFQFIRHTFPEALAIDMESAAIAQTCYIYQTPLVTVRAISDTPGRGDSYRQYSEFWQQRELHTPTFDAIIRLLNQITQ